MPDVQDFTRKLSKKEREEIKDKLTSIRASGANDDYKQLARSLGISPNILEDIEQSPQYVENLIKKIVLKNVSRLSGVVEMLFTGAENGSVKHIDSLIKLLGVSKEVLNVKIDKSGEDDTKTDLTDNEMLERQRQIF